MPDTIHFECKECGSDLNVTINDRGIIKVPICEDCKNYIIEAANSDAE